MSSSNLIENNICVVDVESEIHSKMSKDGNMWYCVDCSYHTGKKSHLYEHVEARHVAHSGYLCENCNKTFKTKDTWRKHVSKHCQHKP